ncbi:DUF742 domain-containing protein [Thermobifida halotolerans]|uniref:DUF742 domain-containing protein n=1 Tax=Thermobifida halotolerans TaxID=483545 RepID=A0A399G652_9ACTN|nr:DUF742 domain-containing protein [Thermobifida halotolerans]
MRWEIGTGPDRCAFRTDAYVGRRRRSRPPVTGLHRVRVRDPETSLPADLPRSAAVVYAACLRAGPAGAQVLDLAADTGTPLGAAVELVGLLRDAALVVDAHHRPSRVDRHLLERVLEGLHRL